MFDENEKFNNKLADNIRSKINNLDFEVDEEIITNIINHVLCTTHNEYSFYSPEIMFEKINNLVDEKIENLIENNEEKIREERSKETVEQKLDKIEDHLIELIKILKEK